MRAEIANPQRADALRRPEGIGHADARGGASRQAVAGPASRAALRCRSRTGRLQAATLPRTRVASAIDGLLASGVDLGPLMGVPVAIKDLFAVEGMPTTAGSMMDVSDLIGPEGTFVRNLKRAGCVILGKTKTVEFADLFAWLEGLAAAPRPVIGGRPVRLEKRLVKDPQNSGLHGTTPAV